MKELLEKRVKLTLEMAKRSHEEEFRSNQSINLWIHCLLEPLLNLLYLFILFAHKNKRFDDKNMWKGG